LLQVFYFPVFLPKKNFSFSAQQKTVKKLHKKNSISFHSVLLFEAQKGERLKKEDDGNRMHKNVETFQRLKSAYQRNVSRHKVICYVRSERNFSLSFFILKLRHINFCSPTLIFLANDRPFIIHVTQFMTVWLGIFY